MAKMQLTNQSYFEKSDDALRYILQDASEAAKAMRSIPDPVAEAKYLEQIADASTVLGVRARAASAALQAREVSQMRKQF